MSNCNLHLFTKNNVHGSSLTQLFQKISIYYKKAKIASPFTFISTSSSDKSLPNRKSKISLQVIPYKKLNLNKVMQPSRQKQEQQAHENEVDLNEIDIGKEEHHEAEDNQEQVDFEEPQYVKKISDNLEPIQIKFQSMGNGEGKEKEAEEEPQGRWFGINKRLYRYPKQKSNITVKTGIDEVLLPQNPQFELFKQQQSPMYEPRPFILEQAIKRDIQIICMISSLMKKIVYDSTEAPAQTKDLNPKDYGVDVLPYYLPQSQTDTTLVFQARFETGNLRRAVQLFQNEYQIILKNDYGTMSHTQWFYFSAANTRKDVQYKFSIINLMKPDSLYNSGMKPLFYSERLAKEKKIGWFRDGYDICYYQNSMKRKNGDFYYSLNFSVKFPYDHDTVYIAHCYPYTYTQLQTFLNEIEADPKKKNLVQRKTLCQTIAGNNCDHIIISDFNNGKEKKGVFLTSRVHPGQTMASYIIEYIIQFLLGSSSIAKVLRQNFLFKIVPMLNIDGVIIGNYRCNLAQVDLNRQWVDPNKKLHPTIFYTKQMIKRMKQQRQLLVYCDFHGHSRKKNCFMYGCAKDNSKKEQIFPAIMRTNCNTFSFRDCCFLIQKDREGASRIALWKQLNIINCFTLEVSFCGADAGKYEYKHFNLDNYRAMAEAFCLTIFDLYEPEQTKVKQATLDLEQNLLKYEKFGDDDSGGDDSDYSNEDKVKPAKDKDEIKGEKDPSKNQIIIKKKIPANILPAKKKK